MESDTIKDSIENLIKARPSVTTASASDESSALTKSLDTLVNMENRHLSIKRKSVALPVTKCNCGKCLKCVPSPSGKRTPEKIFVTLLAVCSLLDWVWNGRKFVQVSKEWKMSDSSGSIHSALCGLIETVESATQKVVDQRKLLVYVLFQFNTCLFVLAEHLAVAQEVGLHIGTFKPSMHEVQRYCVCMYVCTCLIPQLMCGHST